MRMRMRVPVHVFACSCVRVCVYVSYTRVRDELLVRVHVLGNNTFISRMGLEFHCR